MNTDRALLTFWFSAAQRPYWFVKNADFDASIRQRFQPLYHKTVQSSDDSCKHSRHALLACVILFDQIPRNLFRNHRQAFATDTRARLLTRYALQQDFQQDMSLEEQLFLYLPLEHSEDMTDQHESCRLFAQLNNPEWLDYAERHRAIIQRFGRFPQRNAVLNRPSTAEESAFLKDPNNHF